MDCSSHHCKQPAICGTNLQLLQPAGIRVTHWQNVLKNSQILQKLPCLLLSISSGQLVLWREQLALEDTKKGFFLGPAYSNRASYIISVVTSQWPCMTCQSTNCVGRDNPHRRQLARRQTTRVKNYLLVTFYHIRSCRIITDYWFSEKRSISAGEN